MMLLFAAFIYAVHHPFILSLTMTLLNARRLSSTQLKFRKINTRTRFVDAEKMSTKQNYVKHKQITHRDGRHRRCRARARQLNFHFLKLRSSSEKNNTHRKRWRKGNRRKWTGEREKKQKQQRLYSEFLFVKWTQWTHNISTNEIYSTCVQVKICISAHALLQQQQQQQPAI